MTTTRNAFIYLRASTKQQDAERARAELENFAAEKQLQVIDTYVENESGASLERPELKAMLKAARKGDIILIEQVDRLSRLNSEDWEQLKATINAKGLKVVSLDLPTSYILAAANESDFMADMMKAINGMMFDMLAAIARKDYDDRRRRQRQGIDKAVAEGRYKGRPVDEENHADIIKMVNAGTPQREVARLLKCSLSTVVRAVKKHKEQNGKAAA